MFSRNALPPTYFIISILTMLVLHFLIPVIEIFHYPDTLFGIGFIIVGSVLNLWADSLFKEHKTTVKPFEDPTILVTEGPFRFSRNPMYLGMMIILIGIFLLLGTLSPMLVPPIFLLGIHYKFIIPEEISLDKTFGEKFQEYKSQTRRWL
jgi:protein-S-isoprenylcysteine O-methyltransferase Ste14